MLTDGDHGNEQGMAQPQLVGGGWGVGNEGIDILSHSHKPLQVKRT